MPCLNIFKYKSWSSVHFKVRAISKKTKVPMFPGPCPNLITNQNLSLPEISPGAWINAVQMRRTALTNAKQIFALNIKLSMHRKTRRANLSSADLAWAQRRPAQVAAYVWIASRNQWTIVIPTAISQIDHVHTHGSVVLRLVFFFGGQC